MNSEDEREPVAALNRTWDEASRGFPLLRIVGYLWDGILLLSYGYAVYSLATVALDSQPVFAVVFQFLVLAGILVGFVRPLGRVLLIAVITIIRLVLEVLLSLFGGPITPEE